MRENLVLGKDYGVKIPMPKWLKFLSYIPLVNFLVTRKVNLQVMAYTDKGEPWIGLTGKVRIPRMKVNPIRVNFAFPKDVGVRIKVFIRNRRDKILFFRDLTPELKDNGKLSDGKLFAGNWVNGVEIEKIDMTER